jgi:glycine hydroxymethyltransferase
MERAGLIANCNTVPGETRKASDPSGLRLGTAAVTSRGLGVSEMERIAAWIDRAVCAHEDGTALDAIAGEVRVFCAAFRAPGISST